MDLKKNDRIILIVGVVILVISGIGIALYTAPSNDKPLGEAHVGYNEYTYTWSQKTGEQVIGDSLYAGKSSPYSSAVIIKSDPGVVITSVEFKLDWEDDVTYGLIRKKGLDTLNAIIAYGANEKSDSSLGSGNHSFLFTLNERPKDGKFEAASVQDAQDIIDELTSGKNSATFDVTVTVDTGERIFRLFKFLKDKGNDFELTASYTYYTCNLKESEPPDDSGDETKATGDDGFDHKVGEFYVNLGYGRGMI
jgi:hypothetical protein